jgi:hypothetical protein
MYLIIIVIVILLFLCSYKRENNKEHLYIYPYCDRIKQFKNRYKENVYTSNFMNASDCYKKCLDNVDCQYVGVAFDCYNNCFDNVDNEKRQNNTFGDYNQ